MPFNSVEGDLQRIYVDDYALIDQYAKTGSLWLWGTNTSGNLADNTIINKSSPVQTISGGTNWSSVFSAANGGAAIKTDGTLWVWGSGGSGTLGDNTITNKSSPVQTIAGGTNWKQAQQGIAIKTDGTLWNWGLNSSGQLGDNTIVSKSSPVQTIAGGKNWKQAALNAGIKTDGTLWLWGSNTSGQIGDNTTTGKSSPVQTIAAGNNWKQISRGFATAAIKTDGTLWLWGNNSSGQIGDNTIVDKSSPVQTIAGGTNWKQVASHSNNVAAIKTDGTLWIWGANSSGQLGDNTIIAKSSPVQTISGGTNWKQVVGGADTTAAIKTDGTLWLWGFNSTGQLGDNTLTNKSSPVQTIAGGTNWKQVSMSSAGNSVAAVYFYDADNLYPSR